MVERREESKLKIRSYDFSRGEGGTVLWSCTEEEHDDCRATTRRGVDQTIFVNSFLCSSHFRDHNVGSIFSSLRHAGYFARQMRESATSGANELGNKHTRLD